jgi:ribosomal protein L11
MAKALYGFLGEPRASMLLKQVADLQRRVKELEKALEAAEAEVIALRAIAESKVESHTLEEVRVAL